MSKVKDVQPDLKGNLENENISKIRDILFGNNMSEYEKRFIQLEERLENELNKFERKVDQKLTDMEQFFKDELADLRDKISTEESERTANVKRLTKDLESFETKFNKHKESTSGNFRDVRQQLLQASKTLTSGYQDLNNELKQNMEEKLGNLNDIKTDRSTLAVLLTEVALKLGGEANQEE